MEPASTVPTAILYLSKWALGCVDAPEFAPVGLLARLLVTWLPVRRLPGWLLSPFCKLFLPHLSAFEITDGNVNFSFCVTSRCGRQLFLKQAQSFLKWQPQMSLERERMAREVRYFKDVRDMLGRASGALSALDALPRIFAFDDVSTVVVMEFLSQHRVLFDDVFERGAMSATAARALGWYLGHVHGSSLSLSSHGDSSSQGDAARLAADYWNPALRDIQREHVFSVCFERHPRGRQLISEQPEIAVAVNRLKAKYLGYAFDQHDRYTPTHIHTHTHTRTHTHAHTHAHAYAHTRAPLTPHPHPHPSPSLVTLTRHPRYALCHGDFHPGAVMVSRDGDVKVRPTYLPACLPTYLPTCPPTYLPTCPPTCLPAYLPTYLPAYLYTYLPTCLPTCILSTYRSSTPSTYLLTHLHTCILSTYRSSTPSTYLPTHLHTCILSTYRSSTPSFVSGHLPVWT